MTEASKWDLLLQSSVSNIFAVASSSRFFHTSGSTGSAKGPLFLAEYAQTFFSIIATYFTFLPVSWKWELAKWDLSIGNATYIKFIQQFRQMKIAGTYTYECRKIRVSSANKNCIITFWCISITRLALSYWIPNSRICNSRFHSTRWNEIFIVRFQTQKLNFPKFSRIMVAWRLLGKYEKSLKKNNFFLCQENFMDKRNKYSEENMDEIGISQILERSLKKIWVNVTRNNFKDILGQFWKNLREISIFTRLRSRRVVMCLVAAYVRSFLSS